MENTIDPKIAQFLGKLQLPKFPTVSEFGSVDVQSDGSILKLIPSSPSERYASLKIQTDLNWLPVSELVINVVAPASLITQLGKIQAGLSIGVQLVENILFLGPVIEEGSSNDVQAEQFRYEVLTFLQEHCHDDPGAYWLHVGEDAIRLFYFPSIPKNESSSLPLPSSFYKARIDSLMAFGKLLLRVAHRLSFSMTPEALDKCVEYLRKCLELLNEPDHLVVRASVEEQLARVMLDNKMELTKALPDHISGAITSLSWSRQLLSAEDESSEIFSAICSCSCDDRCCADGVFDLREGLPTSLIDQKLWKLVFMVGELFFFSTFKENKQIWKMSSEAVNELRRFEGGISKYVESPSEMDDVECLTAGLICLQSSINGLGNLPTSLVKTLGRCLHQLETRHDAFKNAVDTSKAHKIYSKLGEVLLEYANCLNCVLEDESPFMFDLDYCIQQTTAATKYFLLAQSLTTKIDDQVRAKCAESYLLVFKFLVARGVEGRTVEEALLNAIKMYEKLGDGDWKLDSSIAYKLFSDYHTRVCLNLMLSDKQKAKHHLHFAVKYMQKVCDLFSPDTEPSYYLSAHMKKAGLYTRLPPSDQNQEAALESLLNARHVSEALDEYRDQFWKQLNELLLDMLHQSKGVEVSASTSSSKQTKGRSKDQESASRSSSNQIKAQKLKQLYMISMQTKDFNKLNSMHTIWTSQSNT